MESGWESFSQEEIVEASQPIYSQLFDYFYNVIVYVGTTMQSAAGKGALCAATIAAAVAYVFNHYNVDPDVGIDYLAEMRKKHEELLQTQRRELEQRSQEIRRKEWEESEQFNSRRLQRQQEKEWLMVEHMEEMQQSAREDQKNLLKMTAESNQRIEKLKDQLQMDQIIKDQAAHIAQRFLISKGDQEVDAMEEDRQRSRIAHQKELSEMKRDMQKANEMFEKEEAERTTKSRLEKERFQRRMQEIQEELEKDLEEMRRQERIRRSEMEQQIRQIQQVLRMNAWNRLIEYNWTRRLNTLRSSNEDVVKMYSRMKRYQKDNQKASAQNVLVAVKSQKELMENEKREMEQLYSETNKPFLLVIKDSVVEVREECDRLIYALENEPSNSSRIADCVTALSRVSSAIPTLAELKRQYRESMMHDDQ